MTEHCCLRCDRPMRHDTALVCTPCGSVLAALLQRTAKLAGEAEVTIARLDKVSRGPAQPDEGDDGWWKGEDALEPMALPVNLHAADSYAAAMNTLTTWVRHVLDERGAVTVDTGHPLELATATLAHNVEWLRHRPEADEAFTDITDACRCIERLVDNRASQVLVGRCGCHTWLYAPEHAGDVTCSGCGTVYSVTAAREDLHEQLREHHVTAARAVRLMGYLGHHLGERGRKLIWDWADRGHITRQDHDDQPCSDASCYRFGDVLDRWLGTVASLTSRRAS